MSSQSEHPDYGYGPHMGSPKGGRQGGLLASRGLQYLALIGAILVVLVAVLVVTVLLAPQSSALTSVDARATSEVVTAATAKVRREATRESAAAMSTAAALATESASAASSATAIAFANSTATRAARATIEAPPTLTAEAEQHLEEQAAAQATVQAVEPSAQMVFGPSSGALVHHPSGQGTCDDSGTSVQDFIAEARLYNPYPSGHPWDYAITFADLSADDQYRYEIILDSQQHISLRLNATGYTVEDRTTTYNQLDLSHGGSNLLKVYIVDDTALVYVNDKFESAFDLTGVNLGNSVVGTRDIMVCTGVKDGDSQAGKSTRYDGFTVWSVP